MNIGVIVWSATGNTRSVAETFTEALQKSGHTVTLDLISIDAKDPARRPESWCLTKKPDTKPYDAIVFGAPVEAFSLSGVMSRYLSNIEDLSDKPVFCYVTQFFPKPWMGGTNAVRQLTRLVETHGGKPCGTAVINWSSKKRILQIETAKINLVKTWRS